MISLLTLACIAAGPVAVTWAVLNGLRLLARSSSGAMSWPASGTATDASVETLVAELRRLERAFAELEASDDPTAPQRLRLVGMAYDQVLRRCCAALDLPLPGPPPLAGVVRLEVEAALVTRGLSW